MMGGSGDGVYGGPEQEFTEVSVGIVWQGVYVGAGRGGETKQLEPMADCEQLRNLGGFLFRSVCLSPFHSVNWEPAGRV